MSIDDAFILKYCKKLTILVVEDQTTLQLQYQLILDELFGEVIMASNGQEGLTLLDTKPIDIILSDHYMPVMKGLEMFERIFTEKGPIPSILATSADESDVLIQAINLNISHFVLKPWSRQTLTTAIISALRPLITQQLLEQEQQKHLLWLEEQKSYVDAQQHQGFEKEFYAIRNDHYFRYVEDDAFPNTFWFLDEHYKAHDILSGDAYSLRKIDDKHSFIFLVDAMGKGIAASITSIISSSFLNFSIDKAIEKDDFDLHRMIGDYIKFIKYNLIEDEIVSILFAYFDMQNGTLDYASFSMPPILIQDRSGEVEKLRSNNPPVTSFTKQYQITRTSFENAVKLLLCSDGLTESITHNNTLYMQEILSDFAHANNQTQFMKNFYQKCDKPNDDVTVLYFYLQTVDPSSMKSYTILSEQKELDQAIETFDRFLQDHDVNPKENAKLNLVFHELITNAYEHGNLTISHEEKSLLILEERLLQTYKEREKIYRNRTITIAYAIINETLMLQICDEGEGFDTQILRKLLFEHQKVHGRGIQMSSKVVDTINYSSKGNCVIIHKELQRNSDAT